MSHSRTQRWSARILAGLTVLLVVAACGSSGPGGSGGAATTLSVAEPASGAVVGAPFTVKVNSGVALGTTDTGRHHIHIWFDGAEDKYQISYADTAQVTDVPAGAHTMTVSLRNADHSDAGPRVDVPITVGPGGSGGTPGPTTTTSDPYGY